MKKILVGAWVPISLLILWEAAVRAQWLNPILFPTPTSLFGTFSRLIQLGDLQRHLFATLTRLWLAFLIGGISGVAFGLTLGMNSWMRKSFKPMLSASLTTPKVTLLPIFMLFFGVGETSRLLPVIATCFILCALHAHDAARSIHPTYLDAARNYGARRWQLFRTVYLPASLPRIFTGLRVGLGYSLIVTISAEMLGTESGLGGMIWLGWQTLATENLFAGVICTTILGFILHFGLERLEKVIIPWAAAGAMLVFLFAGSPALAQTTGAIEGRVLDPTGTGIPAVKVHLKETNTARDRHFESTEGGWFLATGLAPGLYQLEFTHPGFRSHLLQSIAIDAGRTVRADARLLLGETRESVQVIAETPLVSTTTADWGSTIARQKLEALPLNGRDLFDLAALEPGTVLAVATRPGIEIGLGLHLASNGARPNQNSFRMDGVYINDAGGMPPSSAAGRLLGIEGVQELRLVSSPFSVEYGRSAGSVLTAISKSGTNQFHGSAYHFLRNNALDAKNFFDQSDANIPPLRRNQFGGLVSGPIRANRLFFAINYEGLRENSATTTAVTTITAAGRLGQLGTRQVTVSPLVRPFLAAYPLPNGREFTDGTGEYWSTNPVRQREDYIAGKIDYFLSQRWRLAARYTADNSSNDQQDLYHLIALPSTSRYQFFHNELQFLQSPATVHTLRAGFSRVRNSQLAEPLPTAPPGINVLPGGLPAALQVTGLTELGGAIYRTRPRSFVINDFQFSHDSTFIRNAHTIRIGSSFDRIQFNQRADISSMGYYRFSSLENLLLARALSADFMDPRSDTIRGWRNSLVTAYAQDEWRIRRNFNFTLGVRYETYSVPTEVNGKIATLRRPLQDSKVTPGGPLFENPSKRNFAPRASFAWDVFGKGRTVFRGGAGFFFDLITSRELAVAGVRLPPHFLRPNLESPYFPDLLRAYAESRLGDVVAIDGFTYSPSQPYVVQMQAALQQQVGQSTVLSVAYAGGRGVKLPGVVGNINRPVPRFDQSGRVFHAADAPPLNPAISRLGMRFTEFNSFSHSLQTSASRRLAAGVRAQLNYTFAKAIDEISAAVFNDFIASDLMPVYSYRDNHGPADFDVRHVLTVNASWQAHSRASGALRHVLNGWEMHGLLRMQSGFAFSPRTGFDRARIGAGSDLAQRPDFVGTPGADLILGDPQAWYDATAFALPAAGYYGNAGRNILRGPSLQSLDVALHKVIWTTERQRLTLRIEGFNITNHPNFQLPSGLAVFNSTGRPLTSAGRITATATPSRQVQLALRYAF